MLLLFQLMKFSVVVKKKKNKNKMSVEIRKGWTKKPELLLLLCFSGWLRDLFMSSKGWQEGVMVMFVLLFVYLQLKCK